MKAFNFVMDNSQEQFYPHFMSKTENINNMINNYNNEVIDYVKLLKVCPNIYKKEQSKHM